MKAKNLCKGILHSKVAMSMLVALFSASTVCAQDNVKANTADSTNVKTAVKAVVVDIKKGKNAKTAKDKDATILNHSGKGTTTGTGTPTEFQDGDDLWLRFRDGRRFMQRPTEKGIYLHQGKKIVVK